MDRRGHDAAGAGQLVAEVGEYEAAKVGLSDIQPPRASSIGHCSALALAAVSATGVLAVPDAFQAGQQETSSAHTHSSVLPQ